MADRKLFDIYKDINERTNGEIFIGVVGPVRSGKSTFIKRFMELCVLPNITDKNEYERVNDELPQSSAGKTIMTCEPKFVPKDAANITVDNTSMKVRLVDSVGFIIDNAYGYTENDEARMVKTPWNNEPIPFEQAASIGTKKIITDHSQFAVVITSDGSFGEFERNDYIEPEKKTIEEISKTNKPFIILLNSNSPKKQETLELSNKLSDKYKCKVIPINCTSFSEDDINNVLLAMLCEFPVKEFKIELPDWIFRWDISQTMSKLIDYTRVLNNNIMSISDAKNYVFTDIPDVIDIITIDEINLSNGCINCFVKLKDNIYYDMLSSVTGKCIKCDSELVDLLYSLSTNSNKVSKLNDAIDCMAETDFYVITPTNENIEIEKPQVYKSNTRYGVRLKAKAECICLLRANLETIIEPIVGSVQQANDLVEYIWQNNDCKESIWNTNIFGKTIEQIILEGMDEKIDNMTIENVDKIKESVEKVMNDNNGLICLIV